MLKPISGQRNGLNVRRIIFLLGLFWPQYHLQAQGMDCGGPLEYYIDWDDDGSVEQQPIYTYHGNPLDSCRDPNDPGHYGRLVQEREAVASIEDWIYFDCAPGDPTRFTGTYTYGVDSDGDGYPYPLTGPKQICVKASDTDPTYDYEGQGYLQIEDPYPTDDDLPFSPGVYKDTDGDGAPDSDKLFKWSEPDFLSGKLKYIAPHDLVWGDGGILRSAEPRVVGIDCNPFDPNTKQRLNLYVDHDEDGYGSGTAQEICVTTAMAVDANGIPIGYSLKDGDCNDNDRLVHENCNACPEYTEKSLSSGGRCVCQRSYIPFSPEEDSPTFRDTPVGQSMFNSALCMGTKANEAIMTNGGGNFVAKTSSAYRSPEYQRHLYTIWAGMMWLNVAGANLPSQCQEYKTQIVKEFGDHHLSPGIAPAQNKSKHSVDHAMDFIWSNEPAQTASNRVGSSGSITIDQIAKSCQLCRPFPPIVELSNPQTPASALNYLVDPIHFVKIGTENSGNCYNNKKK